MKHLYLYIIFLLSILATPALGQVEIYSGASVAPDVEQESQISTSIKNVSVASFPNPVVNSLTINVTGSNDNTVKIVDILGKIMYLEKIGTTKKIDLSDLNNGVYILTITSSNGTTLQNKKIIVKH
ncbi:MAG TPA: T9SS type A sorting domain-containing protein [Crocinitomicaceae bacterium]|nr:T9SS type A sorting domain-containing protein [Crocinitomicaceae bacterium]